MMMGNQILIIFDIISLKNISMLLLGILSIFQTVFLPGFIFLNIFKIKTESTLQKWIYVFAFSLFVNYAIVTFFVILHIYKFWVVFILIASELLILFYLILRKKISINLTISIRNLIIEYISFFRSLTTTAKFLIIIVSVIILFYFSLFIANIGTIFYFVDTVYNIHWNTWAIDFSNNIYPQLSSHFPQLIPANWSLSYLIIGHPNVHFFPKSFMPLFLLSNLFLFLDLAIQKKKYVYLFGLIIYGLFAPIIYNLVFIADGNGDLPVSFFAFISFYAYLKADKNEFKLKEYIIVFLFAATAAGTKLAGLYIFFFLSIACLFTLIKNFRKVNKKEIFVLVVSVIIILAINMFWYFIKPKTMASGLNQPEWLAAGYINILKNALHLLYYNLGLPVLAFLIITIFFSLFTKEAKYISIIFVIPPIVLWMFKYSSDFRNLSFVVPFIAYSSAFGLVKIFKIIKNTRDDFILKRKELSKSISERSILNWILLSFISSILLYFLTSSDSFYQIIYWIYESISKYYFQSNRITYFTDHTFFVHVDFYQKVISSMFLLLSIINILYILRLRLKEILLILFAGALVLNFTVLTEANILKYQEAQLAKVDARNYYQTISTIIKSDKLDRSVFTNFQPITTEKISRDINFTYLQDNKIKELLKDLTIAKDIELFICLKTMDSSTKDDLTEDLSNKKIKILYNDNNYIFCTLIK